MLACAPIMALPTRQDTPPSPKDPHENKLPTSSGEAVLKTTTPPLNYLPSLDEIKEKANDPELKKLSKPKEKLPNARRCRPGDQVCQDYWQKQGKPSRNIGQLLLRENTATVPSLANLLAWNSFSSPLNTLKSLSDVPVGFGAFAPKAAPAAAPAMFQGGVTYGTWPTEMTQGRNRMGGTDLFSGNYHWSVPILGLPGRAGHDLGLSLSYNSHLWVKTLSSNRMEMIDFSEVVGTPGGGFTLGLPFLRSYLHTTRGGLNAYLLVLPSGKAIELIRRGGTTNSQIYESIDGSVLHLVVETSANQYLFFPDGTRLRFQNFQCTEMRDRNGNQITATYNPTYGLLTKLTDTLGREITVHYYDQTGKDFFESGYAGYFEITDLKQSRKDENGNAVTVTLAHFGYSDITINTNFATISGVTNGAILPMLTSAWLANGLLYKFEYTSYGQVKTISRYAPQVVNPSTNSLCAPNVTSGCDYRLLAYTIYNLPSTNDPNNNAVQTDCPRFTSRFDWAFEWNAGVTTTIDKASDNSWGQVTTADGTINREYFNLATTNSESWKDGLPFKLEAYASGQTPGSNTPKKTTLTTWENNATWGPRVANTTVTDGENGSARYSLVEYNQNYNLPTDVFAYKGTGTGAMLSYSNTTYLLNATYIKTSGWGNTQRWIVGLPSASYNYQPNNAVGSSYTTMSKATYQYDQSGYLEHQLPGAGTIINHDTANFGLSFLAGRANLTSATKWDATDENNSTKAITSSTKYNTTGAPTTQYLPDNNLTGRTTIMSYLDSFSDSTANNTLAYPTTVTDPDGKQSKLQYRFDIGAVTRTQDPKMWAADASKGIVSKYDALGRLTRVDNQFSTGYTRYSYDTAFYWLVSNTKADDVGNELYATTTYDGHGRRRANVTAHPNSTLGHRSQYNVYDTMGRVVQSSNPTEVNSSWQYAGGDDNGGYIWSQQTYDWKGRPKVTTNQDGTTKSYEYGGCGCTGEATVTVTDEVGRKTRSISEAFLDHAMQVNKTEVLDMDGTTVYSTTATVNKPLERKSYVLQVAGATTDYSACANGNCNSATRQQTTKTFDGLGRLLQQQAPQQSGTTPYTAYEYYADSSLKKSTDARGAYALLNYNTRGLTTSINYTIPSGVGATPNVSFSYDANGNRETMTDGVGSVSYLYDTLSRMLSETRTFTGLAGSFPLSYEYHGATGQLKKVTDPFGDSISYEYDLAGRTRNITGSAFGGVTAYATNMTYRAWGGTKSVTSDNNATTATMGYDSSMRINNFQMGGTNVNYSYYADSRLYQTTNPSNAKLNQYFNYYDPLSRVTYNSALSDPNAKQYYQNIFHDALSHQTYRYGRYWWMPEYINGNSNTFQNSYQSTNNKITSGWEQSGTNQPQQNVTTTYDNEGNTLTSYTGSTPGGTRMYDAASRLTSEGGGFQDNYYNGDGALVKDYYELQTSPGVWETGYKHHLRSSVLRAEILTTLNYTGAKQEGFVYGNGQLLAKQTPGNATYGILPTVQFYHRDPHSTIDLSNAAELKWLDPMGVPGKAADAAYITQYQNSMNHPDPATVASLSSLFYGPYITQPTSGLNCKLDGQSIPCSDLNKWGKLKDLTVGWGRMGPLSDADQGFLGGWQRVQSNNSVKIPGAGPNVPTGGEDQVWWDWTGGSGLQDPVQLPPPPKRIPLIVGSIPTTNIIGPGRARNINSEALDFIKQFFALNKTCNVIWGERVIANARSAEFIDLNGDPLIGAQTLYELGHPDIDLNTPSDTLHNHLDFVGNYALAFPETGKIYMGRDHWRKTLPYEQAGTYVHETWHLMEGSSAYSHQKMAKWLGLGDFTSDDGAMVALDAYLFGDCKKPKTKRRSKRR